MVGEDLNARGSDEEIKYVNLDPPKKSNNM
jgi:hypothetical protein